MDKNQLTTLLSRYTETSAQEAEEIISLKNEYPYSQLFHSLAARAAQDHHFDNHQLELQMAAVYAADRTVLKEIMTFDPVDAEMELADNAVKQAPTVLSVVEKTEETVKEEPMPVVTKIAEPVRVIQSVGTEDVADELMRDLEKLNSSKHNFEMLLVEYSELTAKPATLEDNKIEEKKESPAATPETKVPRETQGVKKPAKSKRQRIIELAKSRNVDAHPAGIKVEKNKAGGKKKHGTEELIEEIKSTKKEIVPESDKQKEQIAIINQFIKTSPSISNAKERSPAPVGDLNPIKSGEFGDNIVSETLVEILIKQGKKDKAIEVLKKLIWKYPQKKSYFASQIEDLKK